MLHFKITMKDVDRLLKALEGAVNIIKGTDQAAFSDLGRLLVQEFRQYVTAGGTANKQGGAPWERTHPEWVRLRGKSDDRPLLQHGNFQRSITFEPVPGKPAVDVGSTHLGARRFHFGDVALGINARWMAYVDENGVISDGVATDRWRWFRPKIKARPWMMVFQEDIDRWWQAQGGKLGF